IISCLITLVEIFIAAPPEGGPAPVTPVSHRPHNRRANARHDAARAPLERYVNPRKAAWPQADFVVGNPPFIGAASVRRALSDGYTEALRGAWREAPESADFVMHWWHIA
ncbi:hypothetical protein RZS08_02075, partial [Arthrospira platensis SPKY1]|nr:hypothetical protein [Arthrospira platensis SPKY1]